MKTADEFIKAQTGKGVDVDGAYGAQCWDLFAYFCKQAGYPVFRCTSSGYVKDLWNNRNASGILKYFDVVSTPQKGDWFIWGECNVAPTSHIAMFVSANGSSVGSFLGQNQNGIAVANICNMTYAGKLGILRPKCYAGGVTPTPTKTVAQKAGIPEKGSMKAMVSDIVVRTVPSLNKGDTGFKYNKDMTVYYDSVVEAENWYWLSYIGASTGSRRFVAYKSIDNTKVYWKLI